MNFLNTKELKKNNNMIEESNKVIIPAKDSGKEMSLELNWNKSVKTTDVKVCIGKEEMVIDLKDLYFFVFTAGTADMQDDLMPVRQTKVYKQIKQHRIVAQKHIKPGQMIIANCETDIPISIYDGLKKDLFNQKRKSVFAL